MRRFLAISLGILLSVVVYAFPARKELPFQAGEKVHLSVMFKWGAVNSEVAWADLSLQETVCQQQPAYCLTINARTAPFFDVFYRIREGFQSWFSLTEQRPLQCTRDTHEGNYYAWNRYTYDWTNGVIHADVNFNGRGDEHYEIPLQGEVYDLPTLIYHFRTVDPSALKPGDRFPLRFAIDDDVFDITLTFVGRETKKIRKMGKVKTLRFACSVVNGALFDGNKPVDIWFSDDGACLPVAFMAPLRVGAVQGWLKSYEGLKYPFEALIP